MNKGMSEPTSRKVKILFDSMPFCRIKLAAREDVQGRARCHSNVCDNVAGNMSWQNIVDCVWKDIKSIVEEEDENKYDEGEKSKLSGSTDLEVTLLASDLPAEISGESYNSARHLCPNIKLESRTGALSPRSQYLGRRAS